MYTEEQIKEMRDLILPRKAEEQRHLLKQLDKVAVRQLFDWVFELQDKHPDFYRESFAVLAIKDLFFMCHAVLGYTKERYGSDMNVKLHGAICAQLDTRPRRRMGWLIAREHLKTQIITTADTIRKIADDPHNRIVIGSGILGNAVKMMGAIQVQWDTNERLQWLYPYRLPNKKTMPWNSEQLMFSGRSTVFKEPVLEARGVDSELTSSHWNIAKLDDLVGRENSRTDEQLAKTIDWWRKAQPLFTPDAQVDIVGTRYSDGDLYGHLMDIKSPIGWLMIPDVRTLPDGTEVPRWPEYHPIESLVQKRLDMGEEDYWCQMRLDPLPKGSSEFRDDYFHLYAEGEVEFTEVRNRATVCDPAYTEQSKAAKNVVPDFSAIITGGWHPKHGLVVTDIDHGQVGVEKTVDWMHKHQTTWGSKVGVETQSALEDYLNLHNQSKKGKYIRWVKLRGGNHNKDSRIATLIPTAAKQPIWLPGNNPHTKTLLAQLKRWPKSKKRDLMDALAYLPQMIRAVRKGTGDADVTFSMDDEVVSEFTGY